MRYFPVAALLLLACSSAPARPDGQAGADGGGGDLTLPGDHHDEQAPVGGQGGHQPAEGGVGGHQADGGDGPDVPETSGAQDAAPEAAGEVGQVDAQQESAPPADCENGTYRTATCDPNTMTGAALTSCAGANERCSPAGGGGTRCVCDHNKLVRETCPGTGLCLPGESCAGGGINTRCAGYNSDGTVYVR